MDTNYYNYVKHLKHNMPKVIEKGSIIPIKDEEGLGFKFEDSNDPVYHTFKTVDDYDPRMSNVFTKEDTFLDEFLPKVCLTPATVEVVDKSGNVKGYITDKELSKALTKTHSNGAVKSKK